MSNPFTSIDEGDFIALHIALESTKHQSDDERAEYEEEIPQELARIVTTDTLVEYIRSGGADETLLLDVLDACIDKYLYINYGRITLEAVPMALTGLVHRLCQLGASFIVSPDEMLRAVMAPSRSETHMSSESETAAEMIQYYLAFRVHDEQEHPILVIRACENIGFAYEDLFTILAGTDPNGELGRPDYDKILEHLIDEEPETDDPTEIASEKKNSLGCIENLLLSNMCLITDEKREEMLEHAREVGNLDAVELIEEKAPLEFFSPAVIL